MKETPTELVEQFLDRAARVTVVRMSLKERLRRMLFPKYRKQREEETRQTIHWLLEHPEEPCIIEGKCIPNGFGRGPFS